MTEEELNRNFTSIEEAVTRMDNATLMGIAVKMLVRIVGAQEFISEMAKLDLEAQVEEAIKSRAEERAAELVADRTKRSYIGKK